MNTYLRQTMRAAAIGLLMLPVTTFAHHSVTEYDQSVVVEFEGEVVGVFWRNPHITLNVATMVDGERVVWKLEGASVSSQSRRGLTADMINVGDQIRVAGSVSTRRANNMAVDHLLLPSGEELLLRGQKPPRWPDATLVALTSGIDPAKAAAAEANGIFRVWTWGALERGHWFFRGTNRFPLTESAITSANQWDEFADNPVLDCIAPGMPAIIGNPYPMEFVQVGENIELRQEEFDVVRTIYLSADASADVPPSPVGYSIGHWEDDVLVISTSRINSPYFNRVGVPQSEAVEIQERFTLDDEAGRLNYELKVTDPATLTEPYEFKALWVWQPGEVVSEYKCTVDK